MEGHKRLVAEGQVSVTPWGHQEHESASDFAIILLLGSVGAGKSSFIEALSGDSSLGISSDQLEGYTQTVTAYRLVNALIDQRGVLLLDTPGFSDSTLSELEIIGMVKKWMSDHRRTRIDHIMYMCAITDTRIPGSRKATMEMMKALVNLGREHVQGDLVTGKSNEGAVTIVTTMWDTLWNDRIRARAEAHFTQLRNEFWQNFIDNGTLMARFTNTTASALHILDESREHWGAAYGDAYSTYVDKRPLRETLYGKYLYQNLRQRIACAQENKRNWELEMGRVTEMDVKLGLEGNKAWGVLVQKKLRAAEETLAKFEAQLADYGEAPEGFDDTKV